MVQSLSYLAAVSQVQVDIMTEAIKRTVQLRALGVISNRVKIVESSLDEFIAARGAATKFINMLFADSKYNLLKNRAKV